MTTSPAASNGGAPTALGHLRVVEMGDMPAAYCAGYLAGLGADVVKVEPPGGDPNRWLPPFAGDIPDRERGIPFLNANLNKRSIVLDVNEESGRKTLADLLARADLFIEATPVGHLASLGFDDARLKELNPGLVTVSLTPFGQWGPYSHFVANDVVATAVSGAMMSQGDDTRAPIVPPCQISYQLAAVHGAYLALAALRHRRRTGLGQRIDLSLQEALTYTATSAIARYSQRSEIVTRSGVKGGAANIYQAKDGKYVQIAIFMTGHWRVLTRDWMQDPVLSQPEWDSSQYRTDNEDLSMVLIQQFVEQFDSDEFVDQAQKRGLACCPVNSFEDFVTNEHMRARSWFQTVTHPVVGTYEVPGPSFILSKTPWRKPSPAPLLDQHRREVLAEIGRVPAKRQAARVPAGASNGVKADAPMLEGVRIADITRAFAGPIGTMFLGMYGAEVIKVESESLEANREPSRPLFPDMNRAKISCTIDLRNDDGKELFRKLAAKSDVVVDNFSATVMKRLGLGYDDLKKIKPDIIQIGMPGMGTTGPLNWWVSYGNNLQAFTGLTLLWGHPESPMQAHGKNVMPDYVGAALLALATTAALEHRDRTGEGQAVEVCQIDGQGAMMGPAILDYTINKRSWDSIGFQEPLAANLSPFGAYPCRYEDTWIAIACETDEQWRNLVKAMGGPSWATDPKLADRAGRQASREEVDTQIAAWTRGFTPHQALWLLQRAGVPAGFAANGEDLFYDIHLRARGHIVEVEHKPWGTLSHQGLPGIPSVSKASAAVRAPWIGDQNDYVLRQVIGLTDQEVEQGKANGAIH
jgi:crotonobetainyl-CoA:carnitine CoA-transferase CaiB-like acyl-CoA transferase